MSETFTCPNGHTLKVPDSTPTRSSFQYICPVCNTLSVHQAKPSREVPSLLAPPREPTGGTVSHAGTSQTGNQTLASPPEEDKPDSPPPSLVIPGYDVEGELGRGGMGVVYKARQKGLNRLVALKMIRSAALAGEQERLRFRLEAEAVARLQHPNVIQVYEVGEFDGEPYFSLEYVDGGSLAQKLNGTPQPPRYAAELLAALSDAVQAAHEKGIIHRDLKPANVLLTTSGFPKLTDFGLAKQLDDTSGQTQSGAIMGTPSYMAPEQARGNVREIGPACDIHALGAILYECLTGRPPYRAAMIVDTLLLVQTQEPVPPTRLQPTTPRDLETICLRCLEKDPRRRYDSSGALADDLNRFLRGEPIHARPVSRLERALKWVRRKPAISALLACVVLLLVGGVGGITMAMLDARNERDLKEVQRKAAEKAREVAEAQTRLAEEEKRRADDNAEQTQHTLAVQTIQSAQDVFAQQNALAARLRLDRVPQKRRGWECGHLQRAFRGGIATLFTHTSMVLALDYSPDGTLLASADFEGNVCFHDLTGKRRLKMWNLPSGSLADLAFSPDGRRIALAGATFGNSHGVAVWDIASNQRLYTLDAGERESRCVAFSPDGRYLAAGENAPPPGQKFDGPVRIHLWDTLTRQSVRQLDGHHTRVNRLAFSPDGQRLASAGAEGLVLVHEVATGRLLHRLSAFRKGIDHPLMQGVNCVRYSPDGKYLASGQVNGNVTLWDAETGKPLFNYISNQGGTFDIAFSPDGTKIVAAGEDNLIAAREDQLTLPGPFLAGHTQRVRRLAYAPSGQFLASAGDDGTVRLWDMRAPQRPLRYRDADLTRGWDSRYPDPPAYLDSAGGRILSMALSPDGKRVAATAGGEQLLVWDAVTLQPLVALRETPHSLGCVAYDPAGKRLATGGQSSTVSLRDDSTGVVEQRLTGHLDAVTTILYSPDGRLLAVASSNTSRGEVRLWDLKTGTVKLTIEAPPQSAPVLAFHPDGTELAYTVTGNDRVVHRRDLKEERALPALRGEAGVLFDLEYSPDGKRLAGACMENAVIVWDLEKAGVEQVMRGHSKIVSQVAFSPDGKRLASCGLDFTTRLWDVRTGELLLTLPHGSVEGRGLAFTPDGRRLVTGGSTRVLLWDSHPSGLKQTLRGHTGQVQTVGFSPDGRFVASTGGERAVRLWDARSGRQIRELPRHDKNFIETYFSPDSTLLYTDDGDKDRRAWSTDDGREVIPPPPGKLIPARAMTADRRLVAVTEGTLIHLMAVGGVDAIESARRQQALTPDPLWHRAEYNRHAQANRPFAAAVQMEQVLRLTPWEQAFRQRLIQDWTRAGESKRAALAAVQYLLWDSFIAVPR